MLIRIPNNFAKLFNHRIFLILCIFSILALLLTATVNLDSSQSPAAEQPQILSLHINGNDLARMYAEKYEFFCVENSLFVIIDNKIFALVDRYGKQTGCAEI